MKKSFIIALVIICVTGFTTTMDYQYDLNQVKDAVNKSLPLLQKSSYTFLVNAGGCHSCHGQGIGAVAFSMAKEKGYELQDSILQQALDSMTNNWTQRKHYFAQNGDPAAILISGGYDLWAFAANRLPANKTTDLLAKNIMQRQTNTGAWVVPNPRPPIEYYSFSATALAVKGLQNYLPPVLRVDLQRRLANANRWMQNTAATTNEEKIFQLLGLTWANGNKDFIKQQAQKLLGTQHNDGGWSQLDSLPSDAYATGQALYALNQSGQLTTDAIAYRKGVDFLLRTQYPDGSWNVKTRSFPVVPYVDSGFPHGDNQFIAAAGSNWATMALLLASK